MRRAIVWLAVPLTLAVPCVAFAAPRPPIRFTQSGSGIENMHRFTVANDWHLNWSFNCSNFGERGNFQVYVNMGNGQSSLYDNGPNRLGMAGSGSSFEPRGGVYYLEVNSECSWHVTVRGRP